MAWNEPKDEKPEDYDPWTGRAKKSQSTPNQSPPLLEELIKQFFKKIKQVGNGGKKIEFNKIPAKNWIGLVIALLAIVWFTLGILQINRSQEALVFRFGVFQKSLGTGLYWRPWGIDTVQRFDREESIHQTLTADVISQDGNLAHISIKLSYHINNPKDYVLHYANTEQLIQTTGMSVLLQTAANNKLDALLANAKNTIFNEQLQQNLANALINTQTGAQLDQVELLTIAVPDSIKSTFDKIDALYDQQTKQRQQALEYERTHLSAAETKIAAQIVEANTFAAQAKLKALQEVADFLAVFPVYKQNPHFVRYQLYSQTMQEVLLKTTHIVVDEKANGTAFYLPTQPDHDAAPPSSDAKDGSSQHADNDAAIDTSDDSYGNAQGGYS